MLAFVGGIGWLVVLGGFFLFPLIMLIDVVRSSFRDPNDKLIWVLIILFLPFFGALLYLIIGRNQRAV